jgi:hypothetical protein
VGGGSLRAYDEEASKLGVPVECLNFDPETGERNLNVARSRPRKRKRMTEL